MFGQFKIDHEGRSFYCNVSLREHHKFSRDGEVYLYDVDTMSAQKIPDETAYLIDHLLAGPGRLITEDAMDALRRLNLVEAKTWPTDAAAAGTDEGALAAPPPAPRPVTSIALFVAQKCNMRCVYCYGEGGEYSEAGMMNETVAFGAVDWLMVNSFDAEQVQVGFFGGEPLLNFKLMKKVAVYAREAAARAGKAVSFSLTTNGTLLTDEILAFLVAENINPLVSYDGPAEYQDQQRPLVSGKGSHSAVIANLEKLKVAIPGMRGRATLHGDGDPFTVKAAMEEAGFKSCIISKASPVITRGKPEPIARDVQAQRSERMIAFTRAEIDKIFQAIRARTLSRDNPPSLLGDFARLAKGEKKHFGCGVGKDMAGVSASGDIYPCHRFVGQKDMRLGNIRDYQAGEINVYHKAIVDDATDCKRCWGRYMCGGGCFYLNKASTGDMRNPDVADCDERRAAFEEILRVFCELNADDRRYIDEVMTGARERRPPPVAPRGAGNFVTVIGGRAG